MGEGGEGEGCGGEGGGGVRGIVDNLHVIIVETIM